MSVFGLLGRKLSHSFSPMIHAELGNCGYGLFEKEPDELEEFLTQGDFKGLNVTIPYKKAVIPFCAELSDTARDIGSVNTITRLGDGSLYGDNTDYYGFSYLLKKTGADPSAGKTVVLGSGGSSLTVQAVLRDCNAGDVVVVSRTGADNYGNIGKHSDAVLIVNTTPVGMYPDTGVSPIGDLSVFKYCRTAIDIIYNPSRTRLLLQAEDMGIRTANGLLMLVAQAKKSAELFARASIPDGRIEDIAQKIACMTQNIILIGMPGCGKSSIGAELADRMEREFADTDDLVVKAAGKSIPEIFSDNGEDAFRDLEQEALTEICKRSGVVVSTGGGIIKRKENLDTIRQNGVVIFLDRDIADLPTSGRPLSQSEGVAELAKARLPVYLQWADTFVTVCGVEETAEEIFTWLRKE